MEVCYQLPVLPLDRPVPQHVLSRRGAISFSSSSALFGCPNPRQLSQVNRRSRRGLTLGSFSLCFPLPPAFTSATPSFLAVHPDPALPIVWGFVGWPFDLRGFSYILGATYFLVPGLHAGGVREPSRPFPVTRPPRPVLSGLTLSNDFVSLLFSAFQSGSWASLS